MIRLSMTWLGCRLGSFRLCPSSSTEASDGLAYVIDLGIGHAGKARQCENLTLSGFGGRKPAAAEPERFQHGLFVIQHGVMDGRGNTCRGQTAADLIALGMSGDTEMGDIILTCRDARKSQIRAQRRLLEATGDAPTLRVPAVQMRQLDPQDRGLQLVESGVSAAREFHQIVLPP